MCAIVTATSCRAVNLHALADLVEGLDGLDPDDPNHPLADGSMYHGASSSRMVSFAGIHYATLPYVSLSVLFVTSAGLVTCTRWQIFWRV
jgi:hypothetical protein